VKIANNNTLTTTPDAFDVDGVRALYNCISEDDDNDGTPPSTALVAEAINILSSQPNPTTGISTVVFTPVATKYAVIEVFDLGGRSVATLYNQVANQGQEYRIDFDGTALANGLYIYRMSTDDSVVIEKFMIAR
jgi:hypothetical protein